MIRSINSKDVTFIIESIAKRVHEKVGYLTELDSAVGDGDHGANLDRGFAEVVRRVAQSKEPDVGVILELTGATLLSSMGGASGPLYGTAFGRAGRACRGKQEIGIADISLMFQAAEQGIVSLGGAKVGDKTMLDAVHPAAEAARQAVEQGQVDLVRAFELITAGAEAGLETTKKLVSRKGRASYLGERSLGHYDVGAASFCIMVRAVFEMLKNMDVPRNLE